MENSRHAGLELTTARSSLSARLSHAAAWRGGRALFWQFLLIVIVWAYLAQLHFHNDGLWYQGDAPRHLTNGLFWLDMLIDLPGNPKEYALSYYARYPVIHPTAHPPAFYVLEGLAFAVFGASPYVAKGLILVFALAASLYLLAWLRRIVPEAGWTAPLFLLQPGVILWSHTVMLNIPSVAIGLAALWHLRRWLDAPHSAHVYPALILTFVGILTYLTTGAVVAVFLAWFIAERPWAILKDRRAWLLTAVLGLLLVPWALVVYRWAPVHVASVFTTNKPWNPHRWTYYLNALPELFSPLLLGLAMVGVVLGLVGAAQRRETKTVVIWTVASYLAYSYIIVREPRYVLVLGPPLIILAAIGLWRMASWAASRLSIAPAPVFLGVIGILTVVHLWRAPSVQVPNVVGFKNVTEYFKEVAPAEMVFYDGKYDGLFSAYTRLGDPDFKRGVILGDKLLYASAIFADFRLQQYVSSSQDVVKRLQSDCGCRWLAIEEMERAKQIDAARYLREAVHGPEFELVKTFQIDAFEPFSISIYRFKSAVTQPDQIELSFPGLGKGSRFRVEPIHR
jgi:hypothetical protein